MNLPSKRGISRQLKLLIFRPTDPKKQALERYQSDKRGKLGNVRRRRGILKSN